MRRARVLELDVSGLPLQSLPCEELCSLKTLTSLHCLRCNKLAWPPATVREAGGKAVMSFLRERKLDLSGSTFQEVPDLSALVGASICEVTNCYYGLS
jgi:hypothetical protein